MSAESLIDRGFDPTVAKSVAESLSSDKLQILTEIDDRAITGLKDCGTDKQLTVIKQFAKHDLEYVANKSAYILGVLKEYRRKQKDSFFNPTATVFAPNMQKIKEILDRTGYSLEVSVGVRKYGGPPPDFSGDAPQGCEIYVGKLPKDTYEDELITLFETVGTLYDVRLMVDPFTGMNKGFAFITFCDKATMKEAVKQLDGHELKGKALSVNVSVPNIRLFIGNIPKSKSKEDIMEEFSKHTENLNEVIVYASPGDNHKNRGFCFLEYKDHASAASAKWKLNSGKIRIFNCEIIVDWADVEEDADDEAMAKVKCLFVKNLKEETSEEKVRELFEVYGKLEKLKKMKDYSFVFFEERDDAIKAMENLHLHEVGGNPIDVKLARPLMDKKKRNEMLKKRSERINNLIAQKGGMRRGGGGDYYGHGGGYGGGGYGGDYYGGGYGGGGPHDLQR